MGKTKRPAEGKVGEGAGHDAKVREAQCTTSISPEQLEGIKRQQAEPRDCPRFDRCSANICPLDADWRLRNHLKGERICFWLTEAVKPGGAARLRGVTARELAEKVLEVLPRIIARYGPIRRALSRSAKTGPRLGRCVGVRKREVA